MKWISAFVIGLSLAAGETSTASAQILGTFRWQFAPYCNVVTLLVEQKGPSYQLTGTDDGCNGAAPSATVNGSAHVNVGGTIGMSLAVVRPDGFVITVAIDLNPATLSGTWRDDWANSGTFAFNPVLPIAAPPRTLTMRGDWSVNFPATSANSRSSTSVSFPKPLPAPPGAANANVIPYVGPPTANCPGSVTDPQAAPGQLCLYGAWSNADWVRMFSSESGVGGQATATGFSVGVNATAAGNVFAFGRWAVTVP